MRHLTLTLGVVCVLSGPMGGTAAAKTDGAGQINTSNRLNRFSPTRLFRGLKAKALRTWKRWNTRPTRAQALSPLRRMIKSGRLSPAAVERLHGVYPELGPSNKPTIRSSRDDPRMKPMFRMLDSGRITRVEFVRYEKALGIQ